jgi:hypothetical protein
VEIKVYELIYTNLNLLLIFFMLFFAYILISWRRCVMINIYATKEVEGASTKVGVKWTQLIVVEMKVLIMVIIFMDVKKVCIQASLVQVSKLSPHF